MNRECHLLDLNPARSVHSLQSREWELSIFGDSRSRDIAVTEAEFP